MILIFIGEEHDRFQEVIETILLDAKFPFG